jgi:hypothetical protein
MCVDKFLSAKLLHERSGQEITFGLLILMVISFAVIFVNCGLVRAGEVKDRLSPQEINEFIPQIQAAESRLLNIKVDSEAWVETRASLSDTWQRTPIYCSATAWLKPGAERKARVDVHKNVMKWENGAAPYIEENYSVSYDGQVGKTLFHTTRHSDKSTAIKQAIIVPNTPERLRSKSMDSCTGARFTLQFHFGDGDNFKSFSELSRSAISPQALEAEAFEVNWEKLGGTDCIKIGLEGRDWGYIRYWIDPSRGFAFLGHDNVSILSDGRERVITRIRVQQVKEIAENVWWPTEATIESDPHEPNSPYNRTVYKAIKVIANDPNFDESVFSPVFPKGYTVDDKITGKTYVVDANRQ